MAKASTTDPGVRSANEALKRPSEEVETLRRIIVGPETDRIHDLEHRLDDARTRAEELSHILPEAVSLSVARERRLAGTLTPTIEDAIRDSVRRDPKVLADAIFPLMGPGIRRAIAAAIMGMIQSFNQLLNHSFSIQGLKWRFEALRTHRPYAEVLLLHTLVYQVEQVFLIQRASGLVLQHVSGGAGSYQDPDMVSGMLTAIQDFMRDSFGGASDQGLDTLRIGNEQSIWVEQGPKAYLAMVIRGTPPLELRRRMAETLGTIHIRFQQALDEYQGDTAAFENAREDLGACLDTAFKETKQKTSPLLWATAAMLVVIVAWWGGLSLQYERRTKKLIAALQDQPGIVVTGVEKNGRHLLVSGLQDPLADDPRPLLASFDFSENQVAFNFKPYASLALPLVLPRVRQALQPPDSVNLTMDDGVLVADGEAGHLWIERLLLSWSAMPGVCGLNTEKLIDSDLVALSALRRRLERVRILFPARSATLADGQEGLMMALVDDLVGLDRLSERLGNGPGVRILGYTDSSGSPAVNLDVSQRRAEAVYRYIIGKSDVGMDIRRVGMGMHPPMDTDISPEQARVLGRCVVLDLVNDRSLR